MYEESNNSKISNSVLITIIAALVTISVSIILSYSTLPIWSIYIAITSIVIMLFVVLWISPLLDKINKIRERRRCNKLAIIYFQTLKKENYTDQFMNILSDDIDYTFHKIIKNIKNSNSEFNSMPDPQVELIRSRFYFWFNILKHFNGKIDAKILTILLEEFRSIIIAYNRICISEPLRNISGIKNKSGIKFKDDLNVEKDWKKAVESYNYFRNSYNTFLEKINKDFEEIRPGIPLAEEL